MTTQTEMFPKTTLEVLEELAQLHRADYDKAVNSLDALSDDEKIAKAYAKAEDRVAESRRLVQEIDQASERERKRLTTPSVKRGTIDAFTTAGEVSPAVDPITGEVALATVSAVYPGDDEPHATAVGDRTRYSELVADYFTEVGDSKSAVDADEWTVVARRELTQDGGGYRSLHDVIAPEDYGQELLVVALEQGSVTGAAAEKVAT